MTLPNGNCRGNAYMYGMIDSHDDNDIIDMSLT